MTTLLLIDVQKDFHPGGSLAIPTADQDAVRIAQLIRAQAHRIDRIVATMDSHPKLHIAHPSFWVAGDSSTNTTGKKQPDPFTIISAEDLMNDVWRPRPDLVLPRDLSQVIDSAVFADVTDLLTTNGSLNVRQYCIEYARRLEQRGRFKLCIWPEHCLIGSAGHGMVDIVLEAIHEWTQATGRTVEWIMKGQNPLTEMYSALEADVPLTEETAFNSGLHETLMESNTLIVCGQAMSHCVNYTVRDIVKHWPKDQRSRIFLLTDCASAVPGFEAAASLFLKEMEEENLQLRTSSNVLE